MKRTIIILSIIMIAFISFTVVSAENNITQESNLTDLNVSLQFPEEIPSYDPYMEMSRIEIELPDDYNENISVYLDEDLINYGSKNKFFGFHSSHYSLGEHTLRVNFPQTSIYRELNLTQKFSIENPYIGISKSDEEIYVTLQAPKDITGTLTIFVNGTPAKKVDVAKSYGEVGYSTRLNLNPGTYKITAIYSGDGKYKRVEKSKVISKDYLFYIPSKHFDYYGNKVLEISLPYDIGNGKIIVFIDGKKYPITYNGNSEKHEVYLSGLSLGFHNLSATYTGDSKYPKKTINEIVGIYSRVEFDESNEYGDNATFTLKLPTNESGNLTIYISKNRINSPDSNNRCKSAQMINGTATVVLSDLGVGEYYFLAHYEGATHVGDDNGKFKVYPKLIVPKEIRYDKLTTIHALADENATGSVILTITQNDNEWTYVLELINGRGNCTLNRFPIGTLAVSVDFFQNYVMPCQFFHIKVKGNTPILSNNKDVNMYYFDGTTYSVKVKNEYSRFDSGSKVTFKIGSNKYASSTNRNGIAKITIKELPGTYTISATYNGVTVKNKIVVKSILSLSTTNIKKSAKKLTLQATLKKGKTALKNKVVTFKFNGKTYKAKTNNKGIAKVTVPKSVLSKLKVGKTITYQATYLKDTVKRTAKVKK